MKSLLLYMGLLVLPSWCLTAQEAAVPKVVAVWYGDLIGLYQNLFADLDKADDAPSVVQAFRKALAREKALKLVSRFHALAKKYPHFFRSDSDDETTWTPSVDWNKVQENYSLALGKYGNVMKKVFSYEKGHPEIKKALADFGEVIAPLIYE